MRCKKMTLEGLEQDHKSQKVRRNRGEGRETPPSRGLGLRKEPETHRKFGIDLFQPVQKSFKLIPIREGIKVYVL